MVNKTKFTAGQKAILVSSVLKQSGILFPNTDKKDTTLHNQFAVTVSVDEQKGRTFLYYESHKDYMAGKEEMADKDMKYAFRSIIEDAISGQMDFDDFCSEYGYDEDSRRAERVWNECKKSLNKVESMGISGDELYEIINQLSEQGIE